MWINVKEKLPEPYQFVLVYAKMSGIDEPCPMSMGRQYKGEWEVLAEDAQNNACACGDLFWGIGSDEVTHWMPLPPYPKE